MSSRNHKIPCASVGSDAALPSRSAAAVMRMPLRHISSMCLLLLVVAVCRGIGNGVVAMGGHGASSSIHADVRLFEGSEHRRGGNEFGQLTLLLGADGDDLPRTNPAQVDVRYNISTSEFLFTNEGLTGRVNLRSYGHIVASAGDFFGATSEQNYICGWSTMPLSKASFIGLFNSMWQNSDSEYIKIAHREFDDEEFAVQDAINAGKRPYRAFIDQLNERRWFDNFGVRYFFSNITQLLIWNLDHFAPCSNTAYQAAHSSALDQARATGKALADAQLATSTPAVRAAALSAARQGLIKAYAMNAFGDHFLSDQFAAGHIRTPRELIRSVCNGQDSITVPLLGSISSGGASAGIAAQFVHDEDNRNGLWVHNLEQPDVPFQVFGDDMFFDDANAGARLIHARAMQRSRDEVYAAFDAATRGVMLPDSFGALNLVPDPASVSNHQYNNTCPYFATFGPVTPGVLWVRNPGFVRPLQWLADNGILNGTQPSSGDPLCPQSAYTLFSLSECPSALGAKLEGVIGLEYFANKLTWQQPFGRNITEFDSIPGTANWTWESYEPLSPKWNNWFISAASGILSVLYDWASSLANFFQIQSPLNEPCYWQSESSSCNAAGSVQLNWGAAALGLFLLTFITPLVF